MELSHARMAHVDGKVAQSYGAHMRTTRSRELKTAEDVRHKAHGAPFQPNATVIPLEGYCSTMMWMICTHRCAQSNTSLCPPHRTQMLRRSYWTTSVVGVAKLVLNFPAHTDYSGQLALKDKS